MKNMKENKQDNPSWENKNLSAFESQLFSKIKREGLEPLPRWHFLLRDYVVWIAGTLTLLIGSAAVSVMIYLFKYNDWDIQEKVHKNFLEFLILTLPYFWIVFLFLFIFLLYFNIKKTKKGYRYPLWFIATISVLASIIMGGLMHLAGLGQKIDDVLGQRAPFYDQLINRQIIFWFEPSEGRLTGIVSSELDSDSFQMVDPSGQAWLVKIEDGQAVPKFLEKGLPVNVIGQMLDKENFEAEIIKPVKPGRRFFFRQPLPPHREDFRPPFDQIER